MQLPPTTGFGTELASLFFLFITHEPVDVVSYLEVKQQTEFTAASAESGKDRGAVATAVRLWKNHQGFLLFSLVLILVYVLMVLFTPEEFPRPCWRVRVPGPSVQDDVATACSHCVRILLPALGRWGPCESEPHQRALSQLWCLRDRITTSNVRAASCGDTVAARTLSSPLSTQGFGAHVLSGPRVAQAWWGLGVNKSVRDHFH